MDEESLLSGDNQFIISYNKDELIKRINISSSILVDYLRERDVLTEQEDELVRCLTVKNPNNDGSMVEKLLGMMMCKTNKDFNIFCEALNRSNQGHLVNTLLSPTAAKGALADLQHALAEYFNFCYVDDMFCWHNEGHHVDLRDIYVPLQWLKLDPTAAGIEEKPVTEYHQILSKQSSDMSQRIFIQGEAASGKTTCLRKISFDWARLQLKQILDQTDAHNLKETLGECDIVLPIFLRLVKSGDNFDQIVLQQMDFLTKKHILTIAWVLEKNPGKVLIIFDGLDEYHDKTSDDITGIIQGRKYRGVQCLVTSRPEASVRVTRIRGIQYRLAQLKGFDKTHIIAYIKKFFATMKNGGTYSDELIQFLYPNVRYYSKDTQDLQALAAIPGQLCMLCILYKEDGSICLNREQLYEAFVAYIISRWEIRQLNGKQTRTPKSKLLETYEDLIIKLGKLANIRQEYGIMALSFTLEEAEQECGKGVLQYGFLYKSHPVSRLKESRISFLHKSIQDYLAAKYIVKNEYSWLQENCKTLTVLKNEKSLLRYIIHCWLTAEEAYALVKNILDRTDLQNNTSEIVKTIKFLQKELFIGYSSHTGFPPITLNGVDSIFLYQFPFYALATKYEYQHRMIQYNSNINTVAIPRDLEASRRCSYSLQFGIPDGFDTFIIHAHDLASAMSNWMYIEGRKAVLCALCVGDTPVSIVGNASRLSRLELRYLSCLATIALSNVQSSFELFLYSVPLHSRLSWLGRLLIQDVSELTIHKCDISKKDIDDVVQSLKATRTKSKLKELVIQNNPLANSGSSFINLLPLLPQCQSIWLANCCLQNIDFKEIVEAIIKLGEEDAELSRLVLTQNNISNTGYLWKLLDHFPPCIKELHLDWNHLGDAMSAISDHTNRLTNLKWLDIGNNGISELTKKQIQHELMEKLPAATITI